jgi:hypothetical protein
MSDGGYLVQSDFPFMTTSDTSCLIVRLDEICEHAATAEVGLRSRGASRSRRGWRDGSQGESNSLKAFW